MVKKKKSKVSISNTPTLTIQTKKAIVLTLGFDAQTRWENPKYKEMIEGSKYMYTKVGVKAFVISPIPEDVLNFFIIYFFTWNNKLMG